MGITGVKIESNKIKDLNRISEIDDGNKNSQPKLEEFDETPEEMMKHLLQLIEKAQKGTENLYKITSVIEQKQDEKLRKIEEKQAVQESRQVFGKKMSYIMRRKKFRVIWYTVKFILQNVYTNRGKSRDELFRYILQKEKSERNLFDVRWLQKELSSNSFFK